MGWVITIAGIIFGGGMIGQLVQFFVKRHDERKATKTSIYRGLYDKFHSYQTILNNVLLAYLKHLSQSVDVLDGVNGQLNKHIEETQRLIKRVKSFQKTCRGKRTDEEQCKECIASKSRLNELFEIINKEQAQFEQTSKAQVNYWETNSEYLHKIIGDNINIHNTLHLTGHKDKKLTTCLNKIDVQTMRLFRALLSANGNNRDFHVEIFSQISNIDKCLELLSKKFK